MTNKQALSIIDSLRKGWYDPPTTHRQKKADFAYQSYKRSGLEEIKIFLQKNSTEDPIQSLEDFRYQMDVFACETSNGQANFMFSVYYDVATDVLDMLLNF